MRINLLQNLIDILRGKILYLKSTLISYNAYKNISNYSILALGSSHIYSTYIPDDTGLNLGTPSQDLYYSYELYKLLNKKNENIKNVLLSFSVFTPGHCLIKTNEDKLAVLYKILFGIDYQFPEIAKEKHLYLLENIYKNKIKKYLKKEHFDENYRGGMPKNYSDTTNLDSQKAKKIALKHLKNYHRKESQMYLLEQLIKDTDKNCQKFFIVIAPMPEEYRNNLPSKEILFNDFRSLCAKYSNVKIIDLYDSPLFIKEDFFDEHHLNIKGALKSTEVINNIIKENAASV